jgi:hypothetical protein
MDFGKAGWLSSLLGELVSSHDASVARAGAPPGLSARARARAYVRRVLRESGLLYGTPAAQAGTAPGTAPEVVLFLAVVRTFASLALDLAEILGAPAGPRREQLLVPFAALVGLADDAAELSRRVPALESAPLPRRLWGRVETALERRAMSLAGDPAYGLVLHNGAVFADAELFARHAAAYFSRGALRPREVRRRNVVAARRKALLVQVLAALARAEHAPSYPARRAILRQIEDLHLPEALEGELRFQVKELFERPASLPALLGDVRSAEMRHFLLEQALLASIVDGRRSKEELGFLQTLGGALGFSGEEQKRIELGVVEFYAKHRNLVDVFTVRAGAEVMGEEAVEAIQRTVERNFQAVMQEIRETGELSVLLTRAARGQKLTSEERRKMRAQLIDIAKTIPALAIFAAPGGVLLLIALAKVLPFNLLPSAFQEPADEGGSAPERAETWAGGRSP